MKYQAKILLKQNTKYKLVLYFKKVRKVYEKF